MLKLVGSPSPHQCMFSMRPQKGSPPESKQATLPYPRDRDRRHGEKKLYLESVEGPNGGPRVAGHEPIPLRCGVVDPDSILALACPNIRPFDQVVNSTANILSQRAPTVSG